MNWETIASTGVGTLLGGLVSWSITWWYARQGSKELKAEAELLRRINTLTLPMPKGRGFSVQPGLLSV